MFEYLVFRFGIYYTPSYLCYPNT